MAKLDLNRVPMPRQDPKLRGKNFNEVALGYSAEQAMAEASRCIQCPKHPCVDGCPVGVDIPGFIAAVREGDMLEAVRILKDKNALPGICGRVCPQETQCEAVCTLAKKGAPIAIGRLERYVADWERENVLSKNPSITKPSPTGKSVAVIGSGPAGLTLAADLAKRGHSVTIFEALHVAGGVLMYGIPEFRLPKEIVRDEIDYLRKLGVKFETNVIVGRVIKLSELFKTGFDAVFVGSGAGLPRFLGVPGENLVGIYSANEFLIRVNLMKAYRFPEYDTPIKVGRRVAVIGGGNVAMDAARSALRLGGDVTVIYRRTEEFMPARRDEVVNAKEEGVKFIFLATPTRFLGDDRGFVRKVECIRMRLGEPDETGRRRPIPIEGSEFTVDADTAIVAIGQNPNPLAVRGEDEIKVTSHGTIVANSETYETTMKGVFAAGDIVTGNATVISAMGGGKKAAYSIHKYLMEKVEGKAT